MLRFLAGYADNFVIDASALRRMKTEELRYLPPNLRALLEASQREPVVLGETVAPIFPDDGGKPRLS